MLQRAAETTTRKKTEWGSDYGSDHHTRLVISQLYDDYCGKRTQDAVMKWVHMKAHRSLDLSFRGGEILAHWQ